NQQAENAQFYTEGDAYINGTLYTRELSIIDSVQFAESTQLSIAELNISKNTFLATSKDTQVSIGTQQKPKEQTLLGIAGSATIGSSYVSEKKAPENGLLVEGKVNIGGTVPRNNEARTSQLYVKGNAYISDTLSTDTIVFNESMQRSSQQYKDNITDLSIQESLQILEDLKPVKYSYRTDETRRIHAGFIAEKSPEIFTSPDKTMLNSTGIIAILTNVLKEHMHTNSALNRVIVNQQKEIANLRKRVRKLEENTNKSFW
ncbi:MAG: tail fiber domain-containing protein, partial [Rivularia sp. (in: Bacteria)]|nr:tail fiber domain-containing protein [Rivularia sp. MS3]